MKSKRTMYLLVAVGGVVCVAGATQFVQRLGVISPEKVRSPVQREKQAAPVIADGLLRSSLPAVFPGEFRTIDGTLNNGVDPTLGAAGTPLLRLLPADYDDGVGSPSSFGRRSARTISSAIFSQDGATIENPYNLTDFVWQWGQFLDHDIDETPVTSPSEAFDIPVLAGDPFFDPQRKGGVTIPLGRSAFEMINGVREQINNITSFIDASNVYGSDEVRAETLRAMDGTGRLKTSAGNLMPFNTDGFHNAPSDKDTTMFLAGDIRANEQTGLTAMHTLFVREHNRLADLIAGANPGFTGDEIYEHARAFVAAEMQAITYNEFLPRLVGPLPAYTGYDEAVDPSISNLFATAAYRVGHTMLSSEILRLDGGMSEIPAGHLDLAAAFFAPNQTINQGIDPVLRGLATQRAQNVDARVIDDVRNFLFGPPGAGGFDLPALNIQRGRDHGLPPYNDIREAFGLPRAASFSDISPVARVQAQLRKSYKVVDSIDAWVGLLAEPHAPGIFVGETLRRILVDQFVRLRDGDRFWYESYLPPQMVDEVNAMTLAEIIRANTDIGNEIQDDVFVMAGAPAVDIAEPFGVVDIRDAREFLMRYGASDPRADFNGDGGVTTQDAVGFFEMFRQEQQATRQPPRVLGKDRLQRSPRSLR